MTVTGTGEPWDNPRIPQILAGARGSRRALLATGLSAIAASACARRPGSLGNGPAVGTAQRTPRLTAQGGDLLWNRKPFRALGATSYELQGYFSVKDPPAFTGGGHRWSVQRWGNSTHGRRILALAAQFGVRVMRLAPLGYSPAWIAYWHTDPEAYWAGQDAMMQAVQENGVYVQPDLLWNTFFNLLTGEALQSAMSVLGTKTHAMALQFVQQWMTRYRSHPSVLLWELGPTFNVQTGRATKELQPFSTISEMNTGMAYWYGVMKALDPTHLISTGCGSIPYGSAPGEGYTLREQVKAFVLVNQTCDVAQINAYQDALLKTPNNIGGYLKAMAQAAQSELGKPLIVGEFGEDYLKHPHATFTRAVLVAWAGGAVPLARVWDWMATPNQGATQLGMSVDPTTRPSVAALFKECAAKYSAAGFRLRPASITSASS